ncbi:MAG TPA: asparagine synthase (glutamine-hydrolyzing) [Longimicrobiales bacterium]|nr:asparagine synthase (glutamine-hydrolyzing) [Longimicrobiales bacterium]
MCGIVGRFARREGHEIERAVARAVAALCHRGPDDHGQEVFTLPEGTLVLGHTRLSIIDLSAGGHQPMHSLDGRYSIVYNGEIYNYRELRGLLAAHGRTFRTDSDTEVLLACWAQWGAACLARLRGMFAFAVFDHAALTVTCARDAFGIKPLFYCFDGGGFSFASEMPALLAVAPIRPAIDQQSAYDYLVWGRYDDRPQTFIDGIQHLLPGHVLALSLQDRRAVDPVRWWWPSIEERDDLTFSQAAEELREKFLDNVRLHLRSDVAVGAALSGGLDSSAVVCAMRYVEPDMPIHTFSYVARQSGFDEEPWADMVNHHVRAIPHKVVVSPAEIAGDLEDMMRAQGEPFGSTSIYAQYRVYRAAREQGITVVLDGQGADELLAGYHGYPSGYLSSLLRRRRYWEALRFLHFWSRWPGRGRRRAILELGSVLVPSRLSGMAWWAIGRRREPRWLRADILRESGVSLVPPVFGECEEESDRRCLAGALRTALTRVGLRSLLRHGDRNSMRWSVESRVPFLTNDIAEFLLTLPESYLLSEKGETKSVFRAAMRGIVPVRIIERRDKIGFQTPQAEWLAANAGDVRNWVLACNVLPFINETEAVSEVERVLGSPNRASSEAWRLVNFSKWACMQ